MIKIKTKVAIMFNERSEPRYLTKLLRSTRQSDNDTPGKISTAHFFQSDEQMSKCKTAGK